MFESDEAEVDVGVGVGVEVRGCGSGGKAVMSGCVVRGRGTASVGTANK